MTTRNKLTRNFTDSTEQTRDERYATPICKDVSVMSMEPLSPPVTSLTETDLSPLAPPFQPIQTIPANPDAESLCEHSTITSDVDTSTLHSPDEYPPDDDEDDAVDDDDVDDDDDDDVDTRVSDASRDPSSSCGCTLCEEGPEDMTNLCDGQHYLCDRCTERCGGDWWVCGRCYRDGVHKCSN